jgi:hypothetical protein
MNQTPKLAQKKDMNILDLPRPPPKVRNVRKAKKPWFEKEKYTGVEKIFPFKED